MSFARIVVAMCDLVHDVETLHYANISVQYTTVFHGRKNGNFEMKKCDIFLFFCSKHRSWVHVRTASLRRF